MQLESGSVGKPRPMDSTLGADSQGAVCSPIESTSTLRFIYIYIYVCIHIYMYIYFVNFLFYIGV